MVHPFLSGADLLAAGTASAPEKIGNWAERVGVEPTRPVQSQRIINPLGLSDAQSLRSVTHLVCRIAAG